MRAAEHDAHRVNIGSERAEAYQHIHIGSAEPEGIPGASVKWPGNPELHRRCQQKLPEHGWVHIVTRQPRPGHGNRQGQRTNKCCPEARQLKGIPWRGNGLGEVNYFRRPITGGFNDANKVSALHGCRATHDGLFRCKINLGLYVG